MRASQQALDRCESVFGTFMICMDQLHAHRKNLFGSIDVERRTLLNETVRVLAHYQSERTAAAYILIINGMVWDAEIITRSVYETSAKIMLIGAHNDEARDDLVSEYWEILQAIYDRKAATKAEQVERVGRQLVKNDDDTRIFRHLRNPEFFNIAAKGNKRFRDEVERRWSFSEIVKELTRKSDKHIQIFGLESLNHMYGMASHLAHASPKAIDLMDDRATRGDDLLDLEAGHISRILSDLVLLGAFSVRFSQRVVDGTQSLADQLNDLVFRMTESIKGIQNAFARSQDEYYAKFE